MVIKDRLLDESAAHQYVCGTRLRALPIKDRKGTFDVPCARIPRRSTRQTSYAFKLLLDELLSLGVVMRLQLEDMR